MALFLCSFFFILCWLGSFLLLFHKFFCFVLVFFFFFSKPTASVCKSAVAWSLYFPGQVDRDQFHTGLGRSCVLAWWACVHWSMFLAFISSTFWGVYGYGIGGMECVGLCESAFAISVSCSVRTTKDSAYFDTWLLLCLLPLDQHALVTHLFSLLCCLSASLFFFYQGVRMSKLLWPWTKNFKSSSVVIGISDIYLANKLLWIESNSAWSFFSER